MGSSYDKAENKKSAHESDTRKGAQPTTVASEEHVGGKSGVRFKMPSGVSDHSVVSKGKLKE